MADGDTTPAPTPPPGVDVNTLIQQILQGGGGVVTGPAAQTTTPAVNRNLPIASMLGEALGGGVSPIYPMSDAQQTQAGNAALLNFGINMLANSSGPVRHSLGQAIASGLLGAQGSLAGVREGQAQMLDIQNKQQMMRLEQLKEVLPLLRMQQAAGMPNPLAGNAPGGIAATGTPITAANQGDFVQKFTPIAQSISDRTGLPVNYVLAQAGLETGWGSSSAAGNNNYFGITDPATGKLMSYKTPQEGADAYAALMASDRYKNVPRTGSPAAIGDAMAVAGYNPNVPAEGKTDSYGKRVGAFAAALGKPPAATTATTATTPPVPVARPTAVPGAPPGTIQGTPDTGGTLVGGPGALPGDVKAIIGGMTGAGASPTTLAPGTASAGPIAPPVSTVVASNAPTPQQPTQADQPPAPGGQLTFEDWQKLHPSVLALTDAERGATTVVPPNLDDLRKAQAAASQQLDMARRGLGGDPNKSLSDYNTATQAITKAQQDAQAKSAELTQTLLAGKRADAQKLYNDEMTRQQQAQLKAQELAQQAAENEKQRAAAVALKAQEGEQAQTLARINAGTELEKGDADQGRKDIENLNTNAQAASNMQSLLGMIGPQLKDLPSATVGAMLQDHPGAIPFLTKLHLLDGPTANATQLLQGLTAFMATEMKPKGLGPLRIQEMNAFQGALPTLLQSDEGRQKAFAFMNAYSQRIMDEADYGQQYFMRDKPNTAPGAPPGSTVPARNTYGMWSSIGKDLGPVLPTYTGGTQTADDAAKYSAWEQQQQAQPGHAYWGLRKGPDGQRHMELQITPPAGG